MFQAGKVFSAVAAIAAICAVSASAAASGDGDRLAGMVVGRTGEILHISVHQPVCDGTIFEVKLLEREKPIAEARVLSCTRERPFIALAKVVRGDIQTAVPTGVHAYADIDAVGGLDVPKPMKRQSAGDNDRFSLQAGAFYPRVPLMRDTVADYWQAFRLNYSFLRIEGFETLLSVEYTRGSGEFTSGGATVERTMEVIPLTVLGRFKLARLGSAHLFLGAGAGVCRIRSEERTGAALTSTSTDEFGTELAAGLESRRGWTLELRYRDVENTDIRGYSLALGTRF